MALANAKAKAREVLKQVENEYFIKDMAKKLNTTQMSGRLR